MKKEEASHEASHEESSHEAFVFTRSFCLHMKLRPRDFPLAKSPFEYNQKLYKR